MTTATLVRRRFDVDAVVVLHFVTVQRTTLATCPSTVLLVSLNYRVCEYVIGMTSDFRCIELICDIFSVGCNEYDMLNYLQFTICFVFCELLNVSVIS